MKLFFSIIAAAAVIIGYLRAQARLDSWHAQVNALFAETQQVTASLDDIDFSQEVTVAEKLRRIDLLNKASLRVYTSNIELARRLEKKPFSFPLTDVERKLLQDTKNEIAEEERRASHEMQQITADVARGTKKPIPAPLYDAYFHGGSGEAQTLSELHHEPPSPPVKPHQERQSNTPLSTPHPAKKATAEVLRKYPALAQKGSSMNKIFGELYNKAKTDEPELLASPDWPTILAERAADYVVPDTIPSISSPSYNSTFHNPVEREAH